MWIVLDSLRKKHNLNDYSGDLIEPAAVKTCIAQAEALVVSARLDATEAPEVIAQEIVEDLQAALEQFKLIAGDLGAEVAES